MTCPPGVVTCAETCRTVLGEASAACAKKRHVGVFELTQNVGDIALPPEAMLSELESLGPIDLPRLIAAGVTDALLSVQPDMSPSNVPPESGV